MTDPTAAELDAICARLTSLRAECLVRITAVRSPHNSTGYQRALCNRSAQWLIRAGLLVGGDYGCAGSRGDTGYRSKWLYALTPLGVATRKRLIERMQQ